MQKRLRKNAFTYLNGFFGNTQKAILCLSNNGCLLYDSYVGPVPNMIPFDIGISGKGSILSKRLMYQITKGQLISKTNCQAEDSSKK